MTARGVPRGLTKRLLTASVALLACAGLALPSSAEAAAGRVFAFDAANFDATSFSATIISNSDADLGEWSGRISSLRIQNGISVAVYSEPNFGGTCDTFVGRDPWLGNNRIGNDRIASIRLHHNCAGPVVDPVVTDMTAVNGGSDAIQCPFNYVKREMDLNRDAGGDFVYVCLRYESKAAAGDRALATVQSVAGVTSLVSCDSGGTRVNVDLNAGAGGAFVYLCYWTLADNHPNPVERVTSSLRDVEFVTGAVFESGSSLLTKCQGAFEDVASGAVGTNLVHLVLGNLNSDILTADGIWACTLNYGFTLADPPDTTPPDITFVGRTPPNAAGWNNTDVTLTWSCSDAGGVVSPTVTRTITSAGANQSATGTCEDLSGNSSSDTQTGINIDKTSPSIALAGRTAPNAHGWNASDVTVSWTCRDTLSGALDPDVTRTVSSEGANQSATGTCEDRAGNSSSHTQTGINIDKTNPSIALARRTAPNLHGWNNTDVELAWNCSDALSGVLDPLVSVLVATEGRDQSATGTCRDRAGNTASHTDDAINIDKTAPRLTGSTSPDATVFGWHRGDVSVSWTCDDAGGSGLDGPCPAGSTITGEGRDLSASESISDLAGNRTDATVLVDIDRTPPVISVDSVTPHANAHGWNNGDVTVSWNCSDVLSGVGAFPGSQVVSGEGSDLSATGTCQDKAGNSASHTVEGIRIDRTAPTVDVTGVDDGATYTLGSVPAAGCRTEDGLSGVDEDATLSLTGGTANGVGTFTATCGGATDRAGNGAADVVAVYQVHYAGSGFLPPVDDPPVMNVVRAGSAVPVKWSLGGVGALSSMLALEWRDIDCDTRSETGAPPVDATTRRGTSFRYAGNHFQFVAETESAWSGGCKKLVLELDDGTSRHAFFSLR